MFNIVLVITKKPLLKIYADAEATRCYLVDMKRRAIIYGCLSLFIGVVFLYLMINQIEGYRTLTGIGFLLFTLFAWSYLPNKNEKKTLRALPLLYSFHSDGFVFHRPERIFSWEELARIDCSYTYINFQILNLPRTGKRSFTCISTKDRWEIISHFKEYAPERLAKNIKI